ncbi:MAG: hypothetical protein WC961_08230 [Anaerovoracaceae bacterium]
MKRMALVIITTMLTMMFFFVSCEESSNDYQTSYTNPWVGYSSYLSGTDYNNLLNRLSTETSIDRSKINTQLEALKVRQNYEYSYYSSGNYRCHSMTWSYYSTYSFGWVYYVNVDIWVNSNGDLIRSMCSYYSD